MVEKKDSSLDTLPDPGCPGKIELPTPLEKKALDAMRSIKERVRAIKKQLNKLNASANDQDARAILMLEEELARLKLDWDKWERRWQETARERMVLLGHEEG